MRTAISRESKTWVAACVATCAFIGLVGSTTRAQEQADDAGARVEAVAQALERVAVEADRGAWQAADAAYNEVLDALDLHRPAVETALGDQARAAFAEVGDLVDDLVTALDAEDPARVRAVVAIAVAKLKPLAPSLPGPAAAAEAQAVLDWHTSVDTILALGETGAWRDMRNAAMALVADVERLGPRVASAAGTDAAQHVDMVRVFAMRLRAAALDQSMSEARTSAGLAVEALDALGRRLGSVPEPTILPRPVSGVLPRAYIVDAEPGDIVVVPIVLEDVPQIGLGSVDLSAFWSPSGLRLLDVAWDVGAGTVVRDDARGRVDLSLPRAPVGPSGDVVLASLRFEVAGGATDPRDYLPAEVALLEAAAGEARKVAAQGDTPRAAAILADAYATLVAGRGEEDSLYELLDRPGLAAPLRARLLSALDLASQPAETDRIVVALRELEEVMSVAWASYFAAIGGTEGLPIRLVAREITDTTREPLPVLEPAAGLVRLPAWALQAVPDRTEMPPQATPPTPSPRPPSLASPTSTTAVGAATGAEGPFPMALVVVFVVAGAVGIAAVLLTDRRSRSDQRPG